MPNDVLSGAPTGEFNFDGVPGADMTFDDLFGPPEGQPVDSPTTAPTSGEPSQTTQPVAQPQPTAPKEFVLETSTGTKYKTLEEAAKGVAEKDTLIENLRQEMIARTGIDPVTRRPVLPSTQQQEINYLQNPAQFTKDLRAAVEKGDDAAYAQAQLKLLFDALNPVAPLITGYAKNSAIEAVSKDISDFQSFRSSNDFSAVLEKNPILANAINTAEGDYRLHGQLPELYKVAYWAGQGMRTPDLVKAAQEQAKALAAAQPQTPSRPTMANSTLAPPSQHGVRPTITTSEGRKAMLAELEAKGVLDQKF